jgi:hypothetical protein
MFAPKSKMRWFKEWEINHAAWTFEEARGSVYSESDALAEVAKLHLYGFKTAEICEA